MPYGIPDLSKYDPALVKQIQDIFNNQGWSGITSMRGFGGGGLGGEGSNPYEGMSPEAMAITGNGGALPLSYIREHLADFKKKDPSFDISKIRTETHPIFGEVVTDFSQMPGANDGFSLKEFLGAAGMIAATAFGINSVFGAMGVGEGLGAGSIGGASGLGADAAAGMYTPDQLVQMGINPADVGFTGGGISGMQGPGQTFVDESGIEYTINPDGTITQGSGSGTPGIGGPSGISGGSSGGGFGLPGGLGGLLPDAVKGIIGGIAANHQQNNLQDVANRASDLAHPGAQFQQDNIWPAIQAAIARGPSSPENQQGISSLTQMMQRYADPNNPLNAQSQAGFRTASDLVTNPTSHEGYQLATTASRGLQDLYTDPMSNPIMQAVSRLTGENASRRSAAGRGLNSGSMPAEMQDALMAALSSNYSNIANPMNASVVAGSNWRNNDIASALGLGTQANDAISRGVIAGSTGLNSLYQGQDSNTRYLQTLLGGAGFGSPEAAGNAQANVGSQAANINPLTAINTAGSGIINRGVDWALGNLFQG